MSPDSPPPPSPMIPFGNVSGGLPMLLSSITPLSFSSSSFHLHFKLRFSISRFSTTLSLLERFDLPKLPIPTDPLFFLPIFLSAMRSKFKDEHPFEKRKAEAERIRQKYADRIPVICEKVEKSDIATIDKKKYLVPADLTVGQFVYVIRKRIKLSPEKAIFIFVDEVLPPTAALMSSIYEEHKDEDGFLYITYSGENTFGDL
ncbi:hypothetical protein PENSTE_c024G04990 [Penicillium steckii]|nr:hypothetical protein PENSTE_c024G04990 [Penicillium steckii]